MAVTLKDVAEKVGVSKQVVSSVLRGTTNSRVSPAKRETILKVVDELGYRTNHLARSLAENKSWIIGYVTGGIESLYQSSLASLMLDNAAENGYKLLMHITKWSRKQEIECLEQLFSHRVDGVVFNAASLKPSDAIVKQIKKENFPLVLAGQKMKGFTSIAPDFTSGMDEAFMYLIDNNHSRISFADKKLSPKLKAYMASCKTYKIEPVIYEYQENLRGGISNIIECGKTIGSSSSLPCAIIVGNDEAASMIIKGLQSQGLNVPEDVSIISHDNSRLSEMLTPSLTGIYYKSDDMARISIREILAQMELKDKYKPKDIVIPSFLKIRDSVKRLSK